MLFITPPTDPAEENPEATPNCRKAVAILEFVTAAG